MSELAAAQVIAGRLQQAIASLESVGIKRTVTLAAVELVLTQMKAEATATRQ